MYNNEVAMEFEQGFNAANGSHEFNQEFMGETNGMAGELNETQEMEFAHELLSVSNEEELNMFLGSLLKKVGRAAGNFIKSPIGKGLLGALKSVAKKALPIAGGALGSLVGGPLGGAIGGKLGGMAGNLFELELEGLSPEDQEYEMARAYVRFANAAVRNATGMQQRGTGSPQLVLRQALTQAARQYAPGLLQPATSHQPYSGASQYMNAGQHHGGGQQGSWTRRGNTLVIHL